MKKLLLGLMISIAAPSAFAAVGKGEAAPDFTAQASLAGKEFTYALKDALAKGPVVVYFYPSAYTGGCNIQAKTFADHMGDFTAAGASVIGVSLDSIARLNQFSADPEFCASKFPVASDADGKIAASYGLKVMEGKAGQKDTRGEEIGHGFAERTTFVVTSDGKVAATIGGMPPAANVDEALKAVKGLGAAK